MRLTKLAIGPSPCGVTTATAPEDQIRTEFLSIAEQEAHQRSVPVVAWPAVEKGKTEGFTVIHIVTNRAGQVQEASRVSSDNGDLDSEGMRAALRYRFSPLVIDRVPTQIEAPLVIPFKTTLSAP